MAAAVKISPKLVRRLHEYLGDQADSEAARLREELARAGDARARRLERSRPRRQSAEAKRETKAEARRATRPAVEARANGRCEAAPWVAGCRGALHWDHFFGRGKVPPSVEFEWMLCEEHDRQKTASKIEGGHSRLWWIRTFLFHAHKYDYSDAIARCERAIALEEGQHPEARSSARRAREEDQERSRLVVRREE